MIWLAFYLHKDIHPEPAYMISKTFLMGIVLAPIAAIAQLLFGVQFGGYPILFVLFAAFVEEIVKYLAVKFIVLHDAEFDEPVDAMIYMIVAGLGFAAIENILVLYRSIDAGLTVAFKVLLFRFVGATLLHALSTGLIGYFLALSWFYDAHRVKLLWAGIALATLFHFTFNIFLVTLGNDNGFFYSTLILILMAGLVSILFSKIRARAQAS